MLIVNTKEGSQSRSTRRRFAAYCHSTWAASPQGILDDRVAKDEAQTETFGASRMIPPAGQVHEFFFAGFGPLRFFVLTIGALDRTNRHSSPGNQNHDAAQNASALKRECPVHHAAVN
ncbi:MAG: hypothetical protein P4L90_27145 [Rhodopila sp.]|nr:hypothetical protein [Rhodopila sp.]